MATWKAINLEPEDDSAIEIDDTKEIQLEEAFKLYQNALRLHSLGPSHYQEAREAYDDLFKSDVFKYPEALSDFEHDQLDTVSPSTIVPAAVGIVPVLTGTNDNANSLPQLVYLAYKSRAQFEVDITTALHDAASSRSRSELFKLYHDACKKSLISSAAALERDDTDIDLWKRASRVADVLQSVRVVRFCLESVLAGDEEGQDDIDLSGLDEAFAKGELQIVLHMLEDDLSKNRASNVQPKNSLLSFLRQSNDPYPALPAKPRTLDYSDDGRRPLSLGTEEVRLVLESPTHLGIAQALVQTVESSDGKGSQLGAANVIKLELPDSDMGIGSAMDSQNIAKVENNKPETSRTAPSLDTEVESPASFHSVPEGGDSTELSPTAMDVDQQQQSTQDATVQKDDTPALEETKPSDTVALPSRKRSSTAAGNEEPEARTKSKRIKARESLVSAPMQEEEPSKDKLAISRQQFLNIKAADDNMLATVHGILVKVGIDNLAPVVERDDGNKGLSNQSRATSPESSAMSGPSRDLKHALESWTDEKNAAFTVGHGGRDHVEKSTGLSLFQKHSKTDQAKEPVAAMVDDKTRIIRFIQDINTGHVNARETLFTWLLMLFTSPVGSSDRSPYLQGSWTKELRESIVTILSRANEHVVLSFQQSVACGKLAQGKAEIASKQAAEFAETVFELHLDLYTEMTAPESETQASDREQQLNRLRSWAGIASDYVQAAYGSADENVQTADPIVLRYLWASVIFAKALDPTQKDHVLLCFYDLQNLLSKTVATEIHLPNSTAMPEISPSALEQEVSKLKTLDFFMSVFDTDSSDPEAVIMKLEPILEYDDVQPASLSASDQEQIESFRSFLRTGDASLTLFLWKKLQNAYTVISYNTKVVSCLLRSVETVCTEIASLHTTAKDPADREMTLLRWLRDADELITKTLGKIADDKTAFEAIDEKHLRCSIAAVVSLIRIIHVFVLADDDLRVGDLPAQSFRTATAAKNFEKSRDRFRELHVRLWVLLYWMVKEATLQMCDSFENAEGDLIVYLRSVHAALGEREFCRYCNKLFVRTAKTELFLLQEHGDVSADIAQVMYDTYQIKLLAGYGDADHGCTPEALEKDRKTAQTLVPIVMDYVGRLSMKDLLRSDLKSTIDKIQTALGQPKASTAASFNRRAISSYLKSVLNPQRLYQCLRGLGEIETKVVHSEVAEIANSGWYLLLGKMTLAKYRSVKRVNPTPTDDLDNALSFLRQDLEHDASNWESWYRLGQVYDAKIEENLIWNANKLNDGRAELATLERNTINAYMMATAIAMRTADDDLLTIKLINDMYFDFATRLYSSSRPPLDMEAFSTKKAVRHLSHYVTQEMSQQLLFKPITEYSVWILAAHLIRKSLTGESKQWYRFYMLGKCLWKIFKHEQNNFVRKPVVIDDVMDAFTEAVTRVPKKEKSSDPILEPHFKLVSILHKLQDMKLITQGKAVEYLQATGYAKGVQPTQDDKGKLDWETYILAVLKKLQNADKSNWHHRITARAAHVIYDHEQSVATALGAKHQFTDSIFTKNMAMQVWKPENERAGRHYVYTGRYLRFFVEVLDKLRDRSNLEQVVRKIRRKTTDFINHTKVWEDAVTTYVDLLRRIGDIPRGRERAVFDNISFDEFTKQSEKLEIWAHDATTTTKYLDIIRDAIEMKKLNNSLMKGSAIDDLIGDAYACMYEQFISQLPPEEKTISPPKATLPQGTFINLTSDTAPTGDDNLDRMRLNNLLSGQTDGASGSAQEVSPQTAGLGITTAGVQMIGTPPPDVVRVPAPAPAPAKPGRTKTITRREVQRKAEGAVGKPPPIKTPTLTKRSISINVPSIKKDNSTEQNEDDDENASKDHRHDASGVSSRRGSVSIRNTPDIDNEDEGRDGDNEENEDDENEDNEAEETDQGEDRPPRKRLFPGLAACRQKDEQDEEDTVGEPNESDDEAMSDTKADKNEEEEDEVEIPESQEAGPTVKGRDDMDTD